MQVLINGNTFCSKSGSECIYMICEEKYPRMVSVCSLLYSVTIYVFYLSTPGLTIFYRDNYQLKLYAQGVWTSFTFKGLCTEFIVMSEQDLPYPKLEPSAGTALQFDAFLSF